MPSSTKFGMSLLNGKKRETKQSNGTHSPKTSSYSNRANQASETVASSSAKVELADDLLSLLAEGSAAIADSPPTQADPKREEKEHTDKPTPLASQSIIASFRQLATVLSKLKRVPDSQSQPNLDLLSFLPTTEEAEEMHTQPIYALRLSDTGPDAEKSIPYPVTAHVEQIFAVASTPLSTQPAGDLLTFTHEISLAIASSLPTQPDSKGEEEKESKPTSRIRSQDSTTSLVPLLATATAATTSKLEEPQSRSFTALQTFVARVSPLARLSALAQRLKYSAVSTIDQDIAADPLAELNKHKHMFERLKKIIEHYENIKVAENKNHDVIRHMRSASRFSLDVADLKANQYQLAKLYQQFLRDAEELKSLLPNIEKYLQSDKAIDSTILEKFKTFKRDFKRYMKLEVKRTGLDGSFDSKLEVQKIVKEYMKYAHNFKDAVTEFDQETITQRTAPAPARKLIC